MRNLGGRSEDRRRMIRRDQHTAIAKPHLPRARRGNRSIDKRFAAREMLQILRTGGTLGILVDLNTLDRCLLGGTNFDFNRHLE
jgi:hypothetical protein